MSAKSGMPSLIDEQRKERYLVRANERAYQRACRREQRWRLLELAALFVFWACVAVFPPLLAIVLMRGD